MSDKEKLVPCPFCGGEVVLIPLSICSGFLACVGECRIKTSKYWDDLAGNRVKKNMER